MALCDGVRVSGHRRKLLVHLERRIQAVLRGAAAPVRRRSKSGATDASFLCSTTSGWHGKSGLAVPDGLRLLFQPAYTPEVQPAETLWTLVDEPVVNKHIPTLEALDETISMRCAALASDREKIKSQAGFHWWPKIANSK